MDFHSTLLILSWLRDYEMDVEALWYVLLLHIDLWCWLYAAFEPLLIYKAKGVGISSWLTVGVERLLSTITSLSGIQYSILLSNVLTLYLLKVSS